MPRVTMLFQNQFVFHVTGKTHNQHWPDWEKRLQHETKNQKMIVHAFILMSTHFHLLISMKTKHELNSNYKGISWPITNFEQYKNSYRYIYRNPLEAGLCLRAENYSFSTLPALLGKKTSKIPVVDHMGLIVNPQKILEWINTNSGVQPKYSRYD